VDRGVARRVAGNAFGIEPLGDRRGLCVRKFREEAADDLGFDRIDLSFAGRGGDEVIAVGLAARDLALQRSPKLAARELVKCRDSIALHRSKMVTIIQLVRSPTQPSHDKGGRPNDLHMVPLRTSHVSTSIFLGNEVAQPSANGTSKTTSPLS
jgi:hypothetical protein